MPKKTLVRIEEGETAVSVAYGCASLLDAGLEEQLGPAIAEEEGLGSGGQLAVRSARRLQALKHNLEMTQDALARIQDELRGWRRRRQRATEQVFDKAKRLRKLCRHYFEEGEGDDFLGLHGTLSSEPKKLHAAFRPVIGRLADLEWPMPQGTINGLTVDREELVEGLLEGYKELDRALTAVKDGTTREAVAKAARKRAAAAHNTFLGKCTRFLEAALELGGLDELAAAVRPNVGRRGRPPKEKQLAASALPGEGKALPAATESVLVAELTSGELTEDEPRDG